MHFAPLPNGITLAQPHVQAKGLSMRKTIYSAVILSLLTILLGGCAQLVTKKYGAQKGGTVKYSKELFLTEKNRSKAIEVANEYCSPSRAVVLSEEDKTELTGQSSTEIRHVGNKSYAQTNESQSATVYLNFRCAKSKSVARAD